VPDDFGMSEHFGRTRAPGLPAPPGSGPITPFQPASGPSDTDRKVIRVVKVLVAIGVGLFIILPIVAVLAILALAVLGTAA